MNELYSKIILDKVEAKLQFLEDFEKINDYSFGYKQALVDIRKLLRSNREYEKHQIIDGFDSGSKNEFKNGIQYFKKTFK